MKAFGVVGWKNGGKTTLVERLVAEIAGRGFRVSTVKHAHHGFDVDRPGRDSWRHREAGAAQVLVSSRRRWALMTELGGDDPELTLDELLARLSPADLVLVEGYKRDRHPKIEAWRAACRQAPLALTDPTIRAVCAGRAPRRRLRAAVPARRRRYDRRVRPARDRTRGTGIGDGVRGGEDGRRLLQPASRRALDAGRRGAGPTRGAGRSGGRHRIAAAGAMRRADRRGAGIREAGCAGGDELGRGRLRLSGRVARRPRDRHADAPRRPRRGRPPVGGHGAGAMRAPDPDRSRDAGGGGHGRASGGHGGRRRSGSHPARAAQGRQRQGRRRGSRRGGARRGSGGGGSGRRTWPRRRPSEWGGSRFTGACGSAFSRPATNCANPATCGARRTSPTPTVRC